MSVLSSRLTESLLDDSLEDGDEGVRISSANIFSISSENGERGDEGDGVDETTVWRSSRTMDFTGDMLEEDESMFLSLMKTRRMMMGWMILM